MRTVSRLVAGALLLAAVVAGVSGPGDWEWQKAATQTTVVSAQPASPALAMSVKDWEWQ
ncbi:hypothetical protein GCM10009665_15390 [Kitasatospora nipponensis]|uniref:Uncharacterized protein n=1 Tax=Kitasatospora nipponensis TaxID=258049 RepID=A0ABP4GI81_9ACTN